jgi:hypothetical protein
VSYAGLSARGARTLRAVRAWLASHDAQGCPEARLVDAAIATATRLGRDLLESEVAHACSHASQEWALEERRRAEEQRQREEDERRRLDHLARRQADYRLVGDDLGRHPGVQPEGLPVFRGGRR